MEKWIVLAKKADFTGIGHKYKIDPVIARIIRNRDIIEENDIYNYLYGSVKDMHNPRLMKDMNLAVKILENKIRSNKRIRIIGDYDIDGIQSVYILSKGLIRCGGLVDSVIPDRIADGYGINERLIMDAKLEGIDTIITCDNGIAAAGAIAKAKEVGLTVIITDHHEVPYEDVNGVRTYILPNADAVVNPKQQDCQYPFKELCGASVAFKLIQVLYEVMLHDEMEAAMFLEAAAFATVGDVMNLTGENRIIVKEGLKLIQNTRNKGLKALILQNNLSPQDVRAYHIGFILGPCLNASGRLDTANRALQLLMSEDETKAAIFARDLTDLNTSRKELTQKGVKEALLQADQMAVRGDKVFVIYLPDCHESLAGIIAGRIREKYNHPVFVLTKGEEGVKGSGRSIECFSMYDEMVKCKEVFTKFGGHPMAAGLSMKEEDINTFRERINGNTTLLDLDFIPKVKIDVPMPLDYISKPLIKQFKLLEPFGKANEKPVFADKNITVLSMKVIGKNKNVCKLQLCSENNSKIEALYFGDVNTLSEYVQNKYQDLYGCELKEEAPINVKMSFVYYPEINSFGGQETIQIIIKHFC